MKMTPEELKARLDAHKLWLETRGSGEVKGERLDLTYADLTDANLTGADLTRADLTDANLTRANLDYSAWPLWCNSLRAKIDKRLAAQLTYHAMRAMWSCKDDADVAAVLASPECVALANQFHHVNERGPLKVLGGEGEAAKGKEGGAK